MTSDQAIRSPERRPCFVVQIPIHWYGGLDDLLAATKGNRVVGFDQITIDGDVISSERTG